MSGVNFVSMYLAGYPCLSPMPPPARQLSHQEEQLLLQGWVMCTQFAVAINMARLLASTILSQGHQASRFTS
jgi:hypothetical protein